MRVSLFEQMKNKTSRTINDLEIIINLIYNDFYITHMVFNTNFKKSPFNIYFENFDVAMNEIIRCSSDIKLSGNIKERIIKIKSMQSNITVDCF